MINNISWLSHNLILGSLLLFSLLLFIILLYKIVTKGSSIRNIYLQMVGILAIVFFLLSGILLWLSLSLGIKAETILWRGIISNDNRILEIITITLFIIWLAGCFYMAYKERKLLHLHKAIRNFNQVVDDDTILYDYFNICAQVKAKRVPLLARNPLRKVAGLTGIHHPVVMLPVENLQRKELRVSLFHELIHYKKHDILIRVTARYLFIPFWFLPLRKRFVEQLEEIQEILCDVTACYSEGIGMKPAEYYAVVANLSAADHEAKEINSKASYQKLSKRILGVKSFRSHEKKRKDELAFIGIALLFLVVIIQGSRVGHLQFSDMDACSVVDVKRNYAVPSEGKMYDQGETEDTLLLKYGETVRLELEPGQVVYSNDHLSFGEYYTMVISEHEDYAIGLLSSEKADWFYPDDEVWVGYLQAKQEDVRLALRNDSAKKTEFEFFCK